MRKRLVSCLAGLALAAIPVVVMAEEPATHQYPACANTKPSEVEVNTAKAAFQLGQTSFNEGNYKKAIENWEEALRRDCTANALLLNLARAFELDDQKAQAVVALNTYLAREPGTPQRDQIERRVETLNEQIAAQRAAAPPPTVSATSTSEPPPPPPPEQTGRRPILPLIVAGAGGALFLGGGLGYLIERGRVADYRDQCPNQRCPSPAIESDANSAVVLRNVTAGIGVTGLVVGAGGLAWYFLSKPAPSAKSARARERPSLRPEVSPVVGSGFTGVSVSGAF